MGQLTTSKFRENLFLDREKSIGKSLGLARLFVSGLVLSGEKCISSECETLDLQHGAFRI